MIMLPLLPGLSGEVKKGGEASLMAVFQFEQLTINRKSGWCVVYGVWCVVCGVRVGCVCVATQRKFSTMFSIHTF